MKAEKLCRSGIKRTGERKARYITMIQISMTRKKEDGIESRREELSA